MAFITKDQARAAARRGEDIFGQVAGMESFEGERFDIFLSHSIKDRELVYGVKVLLEEKHYKVYVDWVEDEQLDREHVNRETAEKLRQRMRSCSSMIYIATEQSSTSRWMPWELGYFDGYKPGAVAVLPLVDTERSTFHGQEYLGLYPAVDWHDSKPYVDGVPEGRADLWAFVNDTSR
ncbi:TPA: toll/interleukin-1 receptor domain-containing protein [Pseudomonas putida]|nr:toll/interleukin-1 receptor domain-containing protein [Pseudomonas putida]HEN8715214.1 toll/interleukin-1 receptor domain-containing protein [Pseudomonas putida]